MNNFIIWYIVLYLIELILLIFLQIRAVKYLHVKEITIGDIIVIFLIPAFIVVLPALFFCLFAGEISNIVIWRKKEIMGNYIGIDTPDTVCGVNLDQVIYVEYNRNTSNIKFTTTNAAVPELNIVGNVDFFNSIAKKIGIGGISNG